VGFPNRKLPSLIKRKRSVVSKYIDLLNNIITPLLRQREDERMERKKYIMSRFKGLPYISQANAYDEQDPTDHYWSIFLMNRHSNTNQFNLQLDISSTNAMASLCQDITLQRRLLSTVSRSIFDKQWCIDSRSGHFLTVEKVSALHLKTYISVQNLIKKDLKQAISEADHIHAILEHKQDDAIGFEMIKIFICDLLGRNTSAANIFSMKMDLEYEQINYVSNQAKIASGIVLFILNASFMFFTMFICYKKSLEWQIDFLISWIVQFLFEVIIFESCQCVWIHIILPSLVAKELYKVHSIIKRLIDHMCDKRMYDEYSKLLNAPRYLFTSYHIAEMYPTLAESFLVRSYTTHLPINMSQKWHKQLGFENIDDSTTNEEQKSAVDDNRDTSSPRGVTKETKTSYLYVFYTSLTGLLVHVTSTAPVYIQTVLIRLFVAVILSVLTVIAYFLSPYPVLIGLFVIIIIFLILELLRIFQIVKNEKKDLISILPFAAHESMELPILKPKGKILRSFYILHF
jgi:hypothetical protein